MNDRIFLQAAIVSFEIKTYKKPQLTCLGDLKSKTLGGSPGVDDFSGDFNRFPPQSRYIPGQKDSI